MPPKSPPTKYPPPEPGALDQQIELDVTVRVRLRGKREVVEADVRSRLERELPFLFPEAEILKIARAAR